MRKVLANTTPLSALANKKVADMGLIEIFFTGIGLSMDAFAVAICKGLKMHKVNKAQTVIIALFFGGFQAIMPFLGWLLGTQFTSYISAIDHWIAFILLGLIGGNMIRETFTEENGEGDDGIMDPPLDLKELFLLAIATSIDALAVGITFAFLKVSILPAITVIGITTFVFSIMGVVIGRFFGNRYEKKAEFAGGTILIILGIKILLEHLLS